MGNKRIRKNHRRQKVKWYANIVAYAALCFKITSGILLVALMSCAFIFSYDVLTQHDFFKTDSIEVEGIHRLTESEVVEQAQILLGENLFSVNLSTARKRLLAHPFIADARLRRTYPSRIRISIREHEPLAVLDIGRRFMVNTHGEIYCEEGPSDPDTLPVINGLTFSDINVPGQPRSIAFDSVMEVLRLGKETASIIPNRTIKRIHVDREIGLTIYTYDTYDRIRTIKLGYNDYPIKYEQLRNVLYYLKTSPDFSDVDSIDLNNLNRIVVNPSKHGPPAGIDKEV